MNKNNSYGSKERKKKRLKRIKTIHKHVKFLIANHLPELKKLTVNIDKKQYLLQLQRLLNSLSEDYPAFNEYRIANNYLAKFINRGNKEGKWQLEVPAYIICNTREIPLRTERWFSANRCLNHWERKWRKHLASKPASQPTENEEELLAAVLISATFYGGLCLPEALTALANQLRIDSKPLFFSGSRYWMDLVFNSKSQADNINTIVDKSDKEKKPQTLRRWYPDPITLAWMHHFLSKRSSLQHKQKILLEASCWKRIKAYMTTVDKESGQNIKSYKLFYNAAIGVIENIEGVHLSEALAEYAVGKIPCASLPADFQKLLVQNSTFLPVTVKSLEIFFKSQKPQQKNKHKIKTNISYEPLIAEIRTAIQPALKHGIKNTPKKGQEKLQRLLDRTLPEPITILVFWFVYLLKGKKLAISSVYRYFSAIGNVWILNTLHQDLYTYDAADFENLYHTMLDSEKNEKNRNYKAARFEQLHTFAHREFNLAYMSATLSTDQNKSKTFIRAGYITEYAFLVFCKSLQTAGFNDRHAKAGLEILYLLAFRTGLRRGELLKLRMKDVQTSSECWLYIRNNRFGNNKNASAARKIPLSLLLTPEENNQFNIYLNERKLLTQYKPEALLFSLSQTLYIPLDGNWVSLIAKHFLQQITGLPFVFHHFRHTALSRLQAVLEGDQELISVLSPYSLSQVRDIQSCLGSLDNPQNKRDIYWALAGIAGHLTPETTFAHYLHFSDRILANKLKSAEIMLSANAIREISGLTSHAITRLCNSKSLNAETLKIQDFQATVMENLKKFGQQVNRSKALNTKTVSFSNETPKIRATIELCHAVLTEAEQGATLYELTVKYSLDEEHIKSWIFHARHIAGLTTSKNKSRLFSHHKAQTLIGEPLAPSLPQSKAELIDANKAINTFRSLYRKQEEEIKWCIKYYISHANTSSSGLTFHEPQDLKRFLKLMLNVFPEKRWRLRLQLLESSSQDVQVKQWQAACKACEIKVLQKTVRRKSTFPYGLLKLYLTHPIEKQRIDAVKEKTSRTYGKYSANTMRYVFHMIAIMKSD